MSGAASRQWESQRLGREALAFRAVGASVAALCLEAVLTVGFEAGAAVDRTIPAGLEGNLRGLAAAVADHIVHLTLATGAAIVLATGGTAGRATAGSFWKPFSA